MGIAEISIHLTATVAVSEVVECLHLYSFLVKLQQSKHLAILILFNGEVGESSKVTLFSVSPTPKLSERRRC